MTTLNTMTATDFANGIPEWYDDAVFFDAEAKAFWTKHEGDEDSQAAILRKDDTRIQNAGQKIYYMSVSQLYGAGKTNENTLQGYEENFTIGQSYVETGLVRHAVSVSKFGEQLSLFKAYKKAGPALASWLARKKDNDMFEQLITTDYSSETTLFANDAADRTYLNSDCTFGYTEIEKGKLTLETMGAEPFYWTTDNGTEFPVYGCVIDSFDHYHLKGDQRYVDLQAEANIRGLKNPLFTGAVGMIDGMIIYVYRGIRGMQGSRLRPSAKIYNDHTSGVATITVGDSSKKADYTANFPDAGMLCILKNSTGEVEFVTYTGKTTYSFTGCSRGQTYGGVSSSATTYSAGDFVAYGKFESNQVFFGAKSAMRSHTKYAETIRQDFDYGMEKGIGIESIYGQRAIFDSASSVKNYCCMKSNSTPPGAADIG